MIYDGHNLDSDESWEEIIKKGQELQYAYYKAAEDKYSKIWPLFPGWHGSAMAPVIKIICEELNMEAMPVCVPL